MNESLRVQLRNSTSWLNRRLAKYLQRRGWVVFYLDPDCRKCIPRNDGADRRLPAVCWLAIYEEGRKQGVKKHG